MTSFKWPNYPQNTTEFEALMACADESLASEGLNPFQRPLHLGRKFWEAFKWEGLMSPPKELADLPGFTGNILMAKSYRWYEQTYGEALKSDFALGYVPYKLGNAVWRLRAAVIYGQVSLFIDRNLQNQGSRIGSRSVAASLNTLCAIENLPQGLVDRLPEEALVEYFDFYLFMYQGLQWRDELPTLELFHVARADYDSSTADLIGRRYGQARWGAQQAVEKTLKGLLTVGGTSFPTGGPNGHNLKHLGSLLQQQHSITISPALLEMVSCSPKVRYGEEPCTEEQALKANHAVLGVFEQLRTSTHVEKLLTQSHKNTP